MRMLRAANDAVTTVVQWAVAVLTAALVTIVAGNVVARYVFNTGVPWVEELSRLIFVWVVFLGACVAMQHRGHLAIGFLVDRLPATARTVVIWVTNLFTAAFLVTLVVGGWQLVSITMGFGTQTPALRISLAWGYAAIPTAAAVMLLTLVTQTLDGSDTRPVPASSSGAES